MIRAGDLYYYYPNALGSSDGQALTAFQVESGSTATVINSDSLEINDYWVDAIFEGLSDSGTGYVEGQWNHVKYFANLNGEITLATSLPGIPNVGATFYLIHMGKNSSYRSSHIIPGLSMTDLVNITNTELTYASFTNGTGDGEVSYTASGTIFQWKAPGDILGAGVDTTGNGEYTLYSADDSKYIRINITDWSSLPGTDQTDTVTLTQPTARVIPNTEAYQSQTGLIRYVAVFFKNENLSDDMNEFHCWVEPRLVASTTTTTTCDTSAGILGLTDGSSFPARSFWLYNSDDDDCRYVRYRSGNNLYFSDAGGGLRSKTAQTWLSGVNVQVWADVDISLPTLVSDHLPVSLSGLTYSTPLTYDDGLDYGTFSAGTINAVVMRETILDTVYPIDSILTQLKTKWW